MAIIHRAQIRPTKLELLGEWLPGRPWYPGGDAASLQAVGAYRFDDPDGEVGIETHLVRAGDGPVLQVPLTYRGAPLDGAEPFLLATMEHSVLGTRWVYDGCGDPVHVAALTAAVLGGRGQAEERVLVDGREEVHAPSVTVTGSGSGGSGVQAPASVQDLEVSTEDTSTVVRAVGLQLVVRRVLDGAAPGEGHTLTGSWEGQSEPVVLATALHV